jgi:hypothetical protein
MSSFATSVLMITFPYWRFIMMRPVMRKMRIPSSRAMRMRIPELLFTEPELHFGHIYGTRRDGTALENGSCVNIKGREGKGKGRRTETSSSVVDDGGRWSFAGRFILPCARAQNNVKVVGNREST